MLKREQVCGVGVSDVAATATSVNFDLGTSKTYISVNALVVEDVSNVFHGSAFRGHADDWEMLALLHRTCLLVIIPKLPLAGGAS